MYLIVQKKYFWKTIRITDIIVCVRALEDNLF